MSRSVEIFLFPFLNGRFWLINLEKISHEEAEASRSLLDEEDFKKSSRLVFEADQYKFLVVRSLLKTYIANILCVEIKQVTFSYNKFGKPYLSNHALYFNLSHSKNYAFVGIHPSKEIGVDIEKIDYQAAREASEIVCPQEKKWLNSHRNPEKGFFSLWCAKEAYIKAIGSGFSGHSLPTLRPSLPSIQNVCLDKEQLFMPVEKFEIVGSRSEVYVYDKVINDYKLAICTT